MNFKKFGRIINNPRHISGIHNYCDRWCERCPFTLRCSVAAIGAIEDKDARPHNKADETLWPRLESIRPLADALLKQHAGHPGVPLAKDPLFKKRKGDDLFGESPMDTDPLGVAGKRYLEFVHAFVKQQQDILPNAVPSATIDVTPAEAFDVIVFYHTLTPVKLSRALSRDEFDEELEAELEADADPNARYQTDTNGTAKLVLITIDRSILAWAALIQHRPEFTDAALSAMLTLDRLRRGVRKKFPLADKFIRPGFDTVKFK